MGMLTLLPIVNERDEVIGTKLREACSPGDITRVSGLFLYTPNREVLIAKRDSGKKHDPDKWAFAVAGTVEVDETYLSNIIKETEEEIGLLLRPTDVTVLWYGLVDSNHRFFYTLYAAERVVSLAELRPQPGEVSELRLISAPALFAWVENKPEEFSQSLPRLLPQVQQALRW